MMNDQEAAAWEIHEFFQSLELPYAVIGGLAVQWWGEPRNPEIVERFERPWQRIHTSEHPL